MKPTAKPVASPNGRPGRASRVLQISTLRGGEYWRRLSPSQVTRVELPDRSLSERAMSAAAERAWRAPPGAEGVIAERPVVDVRRALGSERRAS